MSNYGYGRQQNPYDQRSTGQAPYPSGGGYDAYGAPPAQDYSGRQQYNQQAYNSQPSIGRDDYNSTYQTGTQNVELEPLAPNGQQYGRQNNPNAIFDECTDIKSAVETLTSRKLQRLQSLQRAVLNDPDTSSSSPNAKELEQLSSDIMGEYRELTHRIQRLKGKPDAGNPKFSGQIGATSRALKSAINQFQQVDSQYQKDLKIQMARQYRIVRPEASDEEVREAVEDTQGQQVFSQALLQSDRRGQSRSALSAVQSRHEEIQKIERQMIELAQLFNDMDQLVVQQEAAVANIEMKGEEVVENMDKGNEQIGVAVKSARGARKKKWWCLGISVLIVIIIVVVILLWQFVFGPNAKSNRDATQQKRWVLPSADVFALPASAKPCSKSAKPAAALDFIDNLELVKKAKRFHA